ncbi:MAG: hypothetical protein RLN85_09665 [Pseudomonadales bacterium]|jgi:hypothetical protein
MVRSFRLVIDNVDDETTVYEEYYITDTALSAEQRLSDLWNEKCAHMPGRGYRAQMFEPDSSVASHTIEG